MSGFGSKEVKGPNCNPLLPNEFGGLNNPDFILQVARGEIPGWSIFHMFGRNLEIDADDREDLWDGGGTYIFPVVASALSVSSDNANDTNSAGSGARTIKIIGLNSLYAVIEETVLLNGLTPVVTSQSFLRVNEMAVLTAGASLESEGTISAKIGANTIGIIPPVLNKSYAAIFTVPAGKRAFIHEMFASILPSQKAVGVKEGVMSFVATVGIDGIFKSLYATGMTSQGNVPGALPFPYDLPIPEKSDIKFRFTANNNNCRVFAGCDVLLEDVSP